MKTVIGMSILALVVAARASVRNQALRAGDETQRLPPGARCDYDDQCGSRICDACACRGPLPEPGGT